MLKKGNIPSVCSVSWRFSLVPEDVERIRCLTDRTGFFNEDEVAVAAELVEERLAKGKASGYFFVLADQRGRLAGYTCYGPIPGTLYSFDLYWIVVHPDFQRKGLGRRLLQQTEKQCCNAGANRIYIDTSERNQYAGTRAFYETNGYRLESVLKDFYAPDDGKVIYCKVFSASPNNTQNNKGKNHEDQ